MSYSSERFSTEYDFLAVCLAAIERRDYKAALISLKRGLDRNLEEDQPVDGREFLRHVRSLVGALDTSLRKAYGYDWGQDIVAPETRAERAKPRCSFCGKPEGAVEKIISGPNVGICDSCVGVCLEILRDAGLAGSGGGTA